MTDSPRIQPVRAVVFDLDGTLYSLGALRFRMTLALWRSLPFLRKLGRARAQVRKQTYADSSALLADLYLSLAQATSKSPDDAARWYQENFRGAFVKLLERRAKVREGIPSLLETLKKREIRTAVLSDFGWVPERLTALRLDHSLFDTIASTEDFGALKPSPVSMLALARNWKVNPQQVLVVGDRYDMDQASAVAAGMRFIGISDSNRDAADGFGSWKHVLARIGAETDSE